MDTERYNLLNSLNVILGMKEPKVKSALESIEKAIDQYGEELWFSFNSGKDNTACFFLTAAVLYKRSDYKKSKFTMKCLYYEEEDPFDECEEHMEYMTRNFKFDPLVLKNVDNLSKGKFMKLETTRVVNECGMKAVIMGSRRTDPYCGNLTHFSQSSVQDGWSDFMRVLPIIDWEFSEVWKFFNAAKITYCSLYDKGYTYLGDKQDSVPNPVLRTKNGWYLPASATNTNFEPFSRKSLLKNLLTNEAGKILISENNIKHLILRVEYNMTPEEIRKEFANNIKSFEIFQGILNDSSNNIYFDINFRKAIKAATVSSTSQVIESQKVQEKLLEEVLSQSIIASGQQLRIPHYVLFLDTIRKSCVIFG